MLPVPKPVRTRRAAGTPPPLDSPGAMSLTSPSSGTVATPTVRMGRVGEGGMDPPAVAVEAVEVLRGELLLLLLPPLALLAPPPPPVAPKGSAPPPAQAAARAAMSAPCPLAASTNPRKGGEGL